MLLTSFNQYFTKLENVHNCNTRQKHRNEFFQVYVGSEIGKKSIYHICLGSIWTRQNLAINGPKGDRFDSTYLNANYF